MEALHGAIWTTELEEAEPELVERGAGFRLGQRRHLSGSSATLSVTRRREQRWSAGCLSSAGGASSS